MTDTLDMSSSCKTIVLFILVDHAVSLGPELLDALRNHFSQGNHLHQVSRYFLTSGLTFKLNLIALSDPYRNSRGLSWFRPLLQRWGRARWGVGDSSSDHSRKLSA